MRSSTPIRDEVGHISFMTSEMNSLKKSILDKLDKYSASNEWPCISAFQEELELDEMECLCELIVNNPDKLGINWKYFWANTVIDEYSKSLLAEDKRYFLEPENEILTDLEIETVDLKNIPNTIDYKKLISKSIMNEAFKKQKNLPKLVDDLIEIVRSDESFDFLRKENILKQFSESTQIKIPNHKRILRSEKILLDLSKKTSKNYKFYPTRDALVILVPEDEHQAFIFALLRLNILGKCKPTNNPSEVSFGGCKFYIAKDNSLISKITLTTMKLNDARGCFRVMTDAINYALNPSKNMPGGFL